MPDARTALTLLLCTAGVWQLALLAHKVHEMERRTIAMMIAIVTAAAGGAVGSFALTAFFGPAGAAAGTLCGALIYVLIISIHRRRISTS